MARVPRSALVTTTFHALASATTEAQCDAILADFHAKAQLGDCGDLESWVLSDFTPKYVPSGIRGAK